LKICVYAISKNEGKFVERFYESAKEADLILIADTGSTDDTVPKARSLGITVHEIFISPWRFDVARNASLALVPNDVDVCVCIDLDEELQPGWRQEIERLWVKGTTRMSYLYDWGHNIQYIYDKIHARSGYRWGWPCHEWLIYYGDTPEQRVSTDKLLLVHKADHSKNRAFYLKALELGVREDPYCPRSSYYYARELRNLKRWDDSIRECQRYLKLEKALWLHERCQVYLILAQCFEEKGDIKEAEKALHMAAKEEADSREPWFRLALLMYKQNRWAECFAYSCKTAETARKKVTHAMDSSIWGYRPHDLASISAWHLGAKEVCLKEAQLALEKSPKDARLANNLKVLQEVACLSRSSSSAPAS
jgi:glycosyltransferase involved in cell wall biosynthesis